MVTNAKLDFVYKLRKTRSHQEAEGILSATLSQFGYDRFVYALIPNKLDGRVDEYININTLDPKWMAFYEDQRLYENDYAALHCVRNKQPLIWSKMYQQIDRGMITGVWAEIALVSWEWGVRNGLTIPLEHVGPYNAGISLIADPNLPVKEQDDIFAAFQTQILEMVDIFHTHVDRSGLSVEYYKLTERQIEILQWLSDGLQIKQIAYKMGTSASSIEKHLLVAKRRLHAATSTQAVARAISLGILY